MHMTRHELGKRVDDGNDRLAEIGVPSFRWRAKAHGRRPWVVVRERYAGMIGSLAYALFMGPHAALASLALEASHSRIASASPSPTFLLWSKSRIAMASPADHRAYS